MRPPSLAAVALLLFTFVGESQGQYRGQPRRDLYKTMNLTSSATQREIKKMYQKWSRMLHPDITKWPKDVAKAKMIEVTEAYEILGDEERREKFDTHGTMDIGTDANTDRVRANLFQGSHDAFVFKDTETMDAAIRNKENWLILFWGKHYPESTEVSPIWEKFATRMKGVVNVGTVQCDDLGQLCRRFGMRTLPSIYALRKGESEKYTGIVEQQSLVDYSASNLLENADAHTKTYSRGSLATSPAVSLQGSDSARFFPSPSPQTLTVKETWQLVTFEYTACMDCRIELRLAVEVLHKYSEERVETIRVDCSKKKNQNFCKQAPKGARAWRVGYGRRTSYFAPTSDGGLELLTSSPVKFDWFAKEDTQWTVRDLTNFVFSHQKSTIFQLTPKAFYKTVLREATAWAILFTTSGECRNCAKYHADWEIMARITRGYKSPKGTRLRVASIDCAKFSDFCSSLGLLGQLPALRMWRGGVKAKAQEPHVLNLMDPTSMLAECKREMEPLTLVDIDASNFAIEVLNSTGEATSPNHWFILYNAGSWCPPCNQIRQPWKDMTRLLVEGIVGTRVKVGNVDCEVAKEFCQQMNIGSYPTMHFFKHGKRTPEPYDGDRSAVGMANFIEDLVANRVIFASGRTVHDMTSSRKHPVMVAFSAGSWCPPCMALKPIWREVAEALYPLRIVQVDCDANRETCLQYHMSGYPTVALYTNGPNKRGKAVVFPQIDKNVKNFKAFVKQHLPDFKFTKPPEY